MRGFNFDPPRTFYLTRMISHAKAEMQISRIFERSVYIVSVAGSTLTPGPMVDEIATR